MLPPARSPSSGPCGFTLVEVTLALGIAAFCLVLLLGLLPTGLNTVQAGAEETAALQRLSAVLADVRATPAAVTVSNRYKLDLAGSDDPTVKEILLDEQGNVVTDSGAAHHRVGYRVLVPTVGVNCSRVYLRISWPGAAAVGRSRGMSEIFATVNRDP